MLCKYIKEGKIDIPTADWAQINDSNSRESIIDCMVNNILQGNIELPLSDITYHEAMDEFLSLKHADTKQYVSKGTEMLSKYEYKYSLHGICIECPPLGNKASNYFQEHARFKCDSITAPSPYRTWHNEKFLRSMLPALWSLKQPKVDTSTLRVLLSLRKYVASQFKPLVAKTVYEHFGAKTVLDFCAGWGDRLCGFYSSSAKEYWGIDPSELVHENYVKQIEAYSSVVKGKTTKMIKGCAEDTELPKDYFDIAFTSPPYFDLEHYDSGSNQSYMRYKKFEDWLHGFLFTAIDNAWRSLKVGGYLVVNISDVYSHHRVFNICDPMNEHIASLGGQYNGVLGMKMSRRPNAKYMVGKSGCFVEPVWVWRKSQKFNNQISLNFEY